MTTSVSFTTCNSQFRLRSAEVTNDSPKQRFISCSYYMLVVDWLWLCSVCFHSGNQVHRVASVWDVGVLMSERRKTIVLSHYGSESVFLEVAYLLTLTCHWSKPVAWSLLSLKGWRYTLRHR